MTFVENILQSFGVYDNGPIIILLFNHYRKRKDFRLTQIYWRVHEADLREIYRRRSDEVDQELPKTVDHQHQLITPNPERRFIAPLESYLPSTG